VRELAATSAGCVHAAGDGVWLLRRDGSSERLAAGRASSLTVGARGVVAAVDGAVAWLTPGAAAKRLEVGAGVTVAADIAGLGLVVGYHGGAVERLAEGASPRRYTAVAGSSPTRLLGGPAGTLAAGFSGGTVALWSAEGDLLQVTKLHGAVVHLQRVGSRLHAATDLGQHLAWDIGWLEEDRCAFLARVRRRIGVVWRDGGARLAEARDQPSCP
jgi:hypothetical protein